MTAKKSSAPKRLQPRTTIEVDVSWLEQPADEPKPRSERGKTPSRRPSKIPRHNTIEVEARWLVPPLPKEALVVSRPPPLPPLVAGKPKTKLAAPIPRDDPESIDPSHPKKSGRVSKRPPVSKK